MKKIPTLFKREFSPDNKKKRIINVKKDKCERGLLYSIVRFLWPIGIAATIMGFIMFLEHDLIYEACLQALTLMMMIYVWPKMKD